MSAFDDLVLEIKACTLCPLSEGRIQAVPGEGSRTADIMFIGEGPGFYEDRDGPLWSESCAVRAEARASC